MEEGRFGSIICNLKLQHGLIWGQSSVPTETRVKSSGFNKQAHACRTSFCLQLFSEILQSKVIVMDGRSVVTFPSFSHISPHLNSSRAVLITQDTVTKQQWHSFSLSLSHIHSHSRFEIRYCAASNVKTSDLHSLTLPKRLYSQCCPSLRGEWVTTIFSSLFYFFFYYETLFLLLSDLNAAKREFCFFSLSLSHLSAE